MTRYTPEQTLKMLWTRLANVASGEGVTVEELAQRTDEQIIRLPNMGRLMLATLRERYPSPPSRRATDTLAVVNQLLGERQARQEAKDEVRAALKGLVDKLDEIAAHPAFKGVWTLYHVHGGVYDGPNWVEALERARKALGG
jgi:hypothetical protein